MFFLYHLRYCKRQTSAWHIFRRNMQIHVRYESLLMLSSGWLCFGTCWKLLILKSVLHNLHVRVLDIEIFNYIVGGTQAQRQWEVTSWDLVILRTSQPNFGILFDILNEYDLTNWHNTSQMVWNILKPSTRDIWCFLIVITVLERSLKEMSRVICFLGFANGLASCKMPAKCELFFPIM